MHLIFTESIVNRQVIDEILVCFLVGSDAEVDINCIIASCVPLGKFSGNAVIIDIQPRHTGFPAIFKINPGL